MNKPMVIYLARKESCFKLMRIPLNYESKRATIILGQWEASKIIDYHVVIIMSAG
jgi:hypothetical protein